MITPYTTACTTLAMGLTRAHSHCYTENQETVLELQQKALDIYNTMDNAKETKDVSTYRFVSELTDLLLLCNQEVSDYRFFFAMAIQDTIMVLLNDL